MKMIFATANKGKLREAAEILGEGYELVTPAEMGIAEDIPETSDTIEGNSLQKASYLWEKTGCVCFADDTGLEIEALGGAPGVYTARYAGEGKDFNENIDKVLAELEGEENRRARFHCVVTLIFPDGHSVQFDGAMNGSIGHERAGSMGFGYDPIFISEEFPGLTLAEISAEDKNAISHRGKALRAMAEYLRYNP
ncbi:MAG: RdgB/HAM1 family non-canonical purine NTP pyrophosphatase [Bacteroidales bacterium]|nr:RdgB/HAM1 family non-canonical purine NTP pyrophosphatase [Bacteroidales bacterium]